MFTARYELNIYIILVLVFKGLIHVSSLYKQALFSEGRWAVVLCNRKQCFSVT